MCWPLSLRRRLASVAVVGVGLEPDAAACGGAPPDEGVEADAQDLGGDEAAADAAAEGGEQGFEGGYGDGLAGQEAGLCAGHLVDGGGAIALLVLVNQDGLLEGVPARDIAEVGGDLRRPNLGLAMLSFGIIRFRGGGWR